MEAVNQFLALLATHNYILVVILIIGWLVQILRPESSFPLTMPKIYGRDPKPFMALAFGVVYGVLMLHKDGETWLAAIRDGAGAGLLTAGAFAVVVRFAFKDSPPAWVNALAFIFPKKDATQDPPVVPPASTVLALLFVLGAVGFARDVPPPRSFAAGSAAMTGCALFQGPAGAKTAYLAAKDSICVIENAGAGKSFAQIVKDCGIIGDAIDEAQALFGAHKAAVQREVAAAAAPYHTADGGVCVCR